MACMKGILFDNDGTLVDTRDIILSSMRYSTRKVLGRVIPDEVLLRGVGTPIVVQVNDFTADEDEQAEVIRVYREHNATIHDENVKAFPGAVDMLATLADRGVALGVVTSKLRSIAWPGLQITGLAPYLSCCIGAEDCTRFKPEAEPILLGADQLGLPASSCLYVGDSPYDIQAGKAAGCKTVAVTWGVFTPEVLEAEKPDYMCDSFSEFTKLAEDLFALENTD